MSKIESKKMEISEPKMVRVFSTRTGDIIISKDVVLKKNDVLLVSEETADYLMKSFLGYVKIVG